MELKELICNIEQLETMELFLEKVKSNNVTNISTLDTSFQSILFKMLFEREEISLVVVTASNEQMNIYYDDLRNLLDDEYVKMFGLEKAVDSSVQDIRNIDTIDSLKKQQHAIYLFTVETLLSNIAIREDLVGKSLELNVGKEYQFSKLPELLDEYFYEKKEFVESIGDYSVRGGIIDIFPYQKVALRKSLEMEKSEVPYRVEFIGDRIESIRKFEIENQRSIGKVDNIVITPNFLETKEDAEMTPVMLLIQNTSLLFIDGVELIEKAIAEMEDKTFHKHFAPYKKVCNQYLKINIRESLSEYDGLTDTLEKTKQIKDLRHEMKKKKENYHEFNITSHPNFNSSMKIACREIKKLAELNYSIFILCDGAKRRENLRTLFEDHTDDESQGELSHSKPLHESLNYLDASLQNGFILHDEKIAILTEHEIFGRTKSRTTVRRKKIKGFSVRDIASIKPGDFIVHIDYGVGKFVGLQKIKIGDSEQECVKLSYEDGDSLFVNLNYINRLKKYSSSENVIPKVNKLGSGEWERLKSRTKKKIKDIARKLITLYAKRKSSEGFAYNADTLWQKELEASFIYEDTPDQATATAEVKRDMEGSNPMDRLVCGDVGYGKTEVAIRAAFKSVMDGKQVAMLVPTTLLVEQHHKTFVERLKNFPVNIEPLSRFQTKREQADILERLKEKQVDIIVGTHRLLSKDVTFKDLGLLIIDEEQRFGVSAKEKLREVKINVDTLTLTATPIPRTLNFSLMGARDLSIIRTAPKNRLPIETELIRFDEKKIREVILREIAREGQVYFVHDKVNNIEILAGKLRRIVPKAKIAIVHGQMPNSQLEKTMLQFLDKKFDILLTTKIIEAGLDIPSVNTILINRAERFGLAELYQLRGRVGRSNIQAYAYFIVPEFDILNKKALQRLQAIEEFTELSSGFNLALRDMEIRGIGNFLGGEQSGFIDSVGFETYCKILDESVEELKNEEFGELFKASLQNVKKVESVLETDYNAYFPDTYISNGSERFSYYQKLYDINSEELMDDLKNEIIDKFGRLPEEAINLFKIASLRMVLSTLKIHKLKLKENNLQLFFKSENFKDEISFGIFSKIIADFEKTPRISFSVKEVKDEVCVNVFIKAKVNYLDFTIDKISNIVNGLEIEKKGKIDESTTAHTN